MCLLGLWISVFLVRGRVFMTSHVVRFYPEKPLKLRHQEPFPHVLRVAGVEGFIGAAGLLAASDLS